MSGGYLADFWQKHPVKTAMQSQMWAKETGRCWTMYGPEMTGYLANIYLRTAKEYTSTVYNNMRMTT